MIKLWKSEELKKLNFRQILQIHDEIIFEGPEIHTEEALKIIRGIMENPLDEPLLVALPVDARAAKTWFAAK